MSILSADRGTAISAFSDLLLIVIQAVDSTLKAFEPTSELYRRLQFEQNRARLLQSTLSLSVQQEVIQNVGQRVEIIAAHAEEAAGKTARVSLAQHYEAAATTEWRRYLAWTIVLTISVVATIAIAFWALSRMTGLSISGQEIGRLSLVVPLLLLATHASRQATYCRNAESEARSAAVRLKTVHAFTDELSESARLEIIRVLGLAIFGGKDGKAESLGQDDFGALAELLAIVKGAKAKDAK